MVHADTAPPAGRSVVAVSYAALALVVGFSHTPIANAVLCAC